MKPMILAILSACMVSASHAAFYTVTGTTDNIDSATHGGSGTAGSPYQMSSLRGAILAANANAGADTIILPAGTYTLTRVGNDSTCLNGDLDINGSLTLAGAGSGTTFIQGASDAAFTGSIGDKVIGINQDGTFTGLTVLISGVTIRYGRNTIASGDPTFAYTGAGVDVFLTGVGNSITFSNCVIANNEHVTSYGGGVNIDSGNSGLAGDPPAGTVNRGTVTFVNCSITNNRTLSTSSTATGGGLNLYADIHDVVISDCVIANNQAATNSTSSAGGGINVRHTNGGTVRIDNCIITNNIAGSSGGGIEASYKQTLIVNNSTVSGNSGRSAGGGFVVESDASWPTSLTNVVIGGNRASSGVGGGVFNAASAPLTLVGCSITNNVSGAGAGIFNQTGVLTMIGGSIIGNAASTNGGGFACENGTPTLTGVLIASNSAAVSGGAIHASGGTLASTFCRIVNNTAPAGKAVMQTGGTATVTNNWWGTNAPAALISGTVGYTPWLQLAHSASLNLVPVSSSTTLTASFLTNSAGSAIAAANLGVLVGVPVTFGNAVRGTLSGAQSAIQSSGTATATLTANAVGTGSADAVVDGQAVTASITIPTAVSAINRVQATPTNLTSVQWLVTFNGAVSGVTASNFGLVNVGLSGTPAITSVAPVGGAPAASWTVAASTGSGSGTLGLNMTNSTGISAGVANLPFTGQTYTIDFVPPVVNCSTDLFVTANGYCPTPVQYSVSVSDNIGLASVATNPPSGSSFSVGTNVVTVTALDAAGNSNSCSFKVVVSAGSPPQLSILRSATNVVVSWPSSVGCYTLQTASALRSNVWSVYSGPLTTNGGSIYVTNSAGDTNRFYRLAY